MLKKYKNQLATFISDSVIPVNEFEITFTSEELITIKHIPTNFVFRIRQEPNDFNMFDCQYTEFSPGFPDTTYFPPNGYTNFEEIIGHLEWWMNRQLLEYLKELDTPDFLEILLNNNKSFSPTSIDFSSNDKFTLEERKLLALGFGEIKNLISDRFDFTDNQLLIVNDRIIYLEEATDRLGKLDWKNILISTVFGIIITLSLDTSKGQMLWDLFSKVLDNLPQLPIHP